MSASGLLNAARTLAVLAVAIPACPAFADEGGGSLYLLGSGGPGAGILPPLKGIYLDNTIYIYDGGSKSQRNLVIGGTIVADVDATLPINMTSLLWVPTTDLGRGTLALGATLPIGAPMIDAGVTLTGPGGTQIGGSRHDSALVVGDPIVSASLGWKFGKLHISANGILNIPVGNYREGQLANVAFHRWAGDFSLAGSWHDVTEGAGWDISAKLGVTLNGTNDVTDYTSGTDLHAEAALERIFSPKFSAGLLGYYFNQISDDSGSGAKLGGYQGEVAGVGGTIAFNTKLGRSPATFRLKVLQEFAATNRMEGTGAFLSLTLPLSMKMPAGMKE